MAKRLLLTTRMPFCKRCYHKMHGLFTIFIRACCDMDNEFVYLSDLAATGVRLPICATTIKRWCNHNKSQTIHSIHVHPPFCSLVSTGVLVQRSPRLTFSIRG